MNTNIMRALSTSALALSLSFVSFGCASYPKTHPLTAYDLSKGYRFERLDRSSEGNASSKNSDELFVILSFSGGGTRAAALSYGVLQQLDHVKFHWDAAKGEPVHCTPAESAECRAKERSLLDEVDVISSVSGGSFTAAYYGLRGREIFDGGSPFHRQFLYYPLQRDLFATAVYHPQNWRRLRSRPEIAARLYGSRVFGEATFADLPQRRPYIILNATDMSTGARFEFTQEQFDLLCADLTSFPVARAVAASSAFPGLLNSMTIDSFNATGCGYTGPGSGARDDWTLLAAKDNRLDFRARVAREIHAYRRTDREHLHLLDGGLADNIGLRSVLQSLHSTDRPVHRDGNNSVLGGWSVLNMINESKIKKIVVIAVNAKTNRARDWDTKSAGPGTFTVIGSASGLPMGNYSRETLELLREFGFDAGLNDPHDPTAPSFYGVEVAFENLTAPGEAAFLGSIGTNFGISRFEVDCLIDRGARLLREAQSVTEDTARPFAAFVADDLQGGRIDVPSGAAPASCTAEAGRRGIGIRDHAIDIGVQIGAAFPQGDDLVDEGARPALAFRAIRPDGWGIVLDLGRARLPLQASVGGSRVEIGDVGLWTLMAGIGRTRQAGRAELTLGVSAGVGIGSMSVSADAHDAYGRIGHFALNGDASHPWLVKPQASLWYNLTSRWAATVSTSYLFARPNVTITSSEGTPYDREVNASSVRVAAGIGFKVF